MKNKKMLFVYNPHAGKGQIRNNLLDIIDIFVKAGYEVTVYPTQASGDAVIKVREKSSRYDMVVCCGGDGTLDEVVTGMMQCEKRKTIGYVPAGSTNDFADSLHIPKNMKKAAEVVVSGEKFPCDVGSFNEDTFVYIAAFGIFTDVSYETKQNMKNVLGHMAYLLEGMKRLAMVPSYRMKITYEDQVIEDEFMFGMITNSESVGGFKRITGKWVELDDGVFEVTLIKKPANPLELNSILSALVLKDIDTEYMYCFRTNHVEFQSEKEIAWTLDGEYGGGHKSAVIENQKQAIKIMIPGENLERSVPESEI
ncbi:MAG: YegS/Rv2252/BmrU family lipid kinase [Lachnospiraceae bacterium]|nr:YegS/Rv2252/BmrU family lipid kinase [Lachnospiraceae bacterium]